MIWKSVPINFKLLIVLNTVNPVPEIIKINIQIYESEEGLQVTY